MRTEDISLDANGMGAKDRERRSDAGGALRKSRPFHRECLDWLGRQVPDFQLPGNGVVALYRPRTGILARRRRKRPYQRVQKNRSMTYVLRVKQDVHTLKFLGRSQCVSIVPRHPRNFDPKELSGTVKPYNKHIFVCSGKRDWPKKPEREEGSIMQMLSLALKSAVADSGQAKK